MMKHFLTASLQQGLGTVVNRSSYLLPLQRKYIISLFRDTKPNLWMAAEWKHISYIIWDLWTFLSPSLWHLYHENLFAGSGETLFSSSFSSALIKLPVESLQGGNAQKSLLCPHQHSHLLARPWKKDLWGILCLEHQAVRAASSPRGSDLTRSWKRSSELLVHADSTASCWCRFTARIHENVNSFTSRSCDRTEICGDRVRAVNSGSRLRCSELWHMEHYPDGRSITRWFTWWAATLRLAVGFKWCSDGTKGPKVCSKRIPHTIRRMNCW